LLLLLDRGGIFLETGFFSGYAAIASENLSWLKSAPAAMGFSYKGTWNLRR